MAGTRWRALGIILGGFTVVLAGFFSLLAGPVMGVKVAAAMLIAGIVVAACFPIIYVTSVALHEAGHAMAAAAVGIPVRAVHIGGGTPVARLSIAGMPWAVAFQRLGGQTVPGELSPGRDQPWRIVVFVLGGPLATAMVGVGALLIARHTPSPAAELMKGFALIQLLSVVENLIPRSTTSVDGTPVPNDGMHLGSLVWRGSRHRRHRAAHAALAVGDPAAAAANAAVLLESSTDPGERAQLLNLFAYAAIIDGSPEHEERAARAIEEAVALSPDTPAFLDTQALVLATRGDGGLARPIAEKLVATVAGHAWEPSVTATLALALYASGEPDAALRTLDRARDLDADDMTVRFVASRLANAPS